MLSWIVYFFRTTFCGGGGGERECHAYNKFLVLYVLMCSVKKFGGRAKVYCMYCIVLDLERSGKRECVAGDPLVG